MPIDWIEWGMYKKVRVLPATMRAYRQALSAV
jgi:hypothetical protein